VRARPQKPNPLAEQIVAHRNITVCHAEKRFDHSKLFIFDDRTVVLGSMGIGDAHHQDWVETAVRLDGEEHVRRLRERLSDDVAFDPGRRIDFLTHSRDAHPVKSCPMLGHRLALIDAAESSLVIAMAYLGDRRYTDALIRAVRRGVDVTLVTAACSDVLGNLGRGTCDRLLRKTGAPSNLAIVFLPRMVHAKVVVRDGRWTDIGSANFTPLSHGVYDEINVHVDDPAFARSVEEAIDAHCWEGELASERVGYNRIYYNIERAIVAYQGRKGG
jgi:cardiolipin synthase